jgi:hypothetical protein
MYVKNAVAKGLITAIAAVAVLAGGAVSASAQTSAQISAQTGASGELLTLSGQVERGVEHGCLVLRSGLEVYNLLVDDNPLVYPGARVVVTGYARTDVVTYCMQGVPFQVKSVDPA